MSRLLIFAVLSFGLFMLESGVRAQEAGSDDRAAKIAEAEAEARKLFAEDHYVFLTRRGRVDPAEGGIPAYALGERHWSLYRGSYHVNEIRALRAIGRYEDARRAKWRKVLWGTVTTLGAGVAAGSAYSVDFYDGVDLQDGLGSVGFVGGLVAASVAKVQFAKKSLPLEEIFLDFQKLNDQIRENIRAQVRLDHGVPLEPPSGEEE